MSQSTMVGPPKIQQYQGQRGTKGPQIETGDNRRQLGMVFLGPKIVLEHVAKGVLEYQDFVQKGTHRGDTEIPPNTKGTRGT